MSSLTILINYGGRWANSMYKNYKSKGLLVSEKITFEELRNKVYNIANVDQNEYEVTMKVIYDAMKSAWPTEIVNDDDVRAFIFESLSRSYKVPLCITVKRKVDELHFENMQFEDMPHVEVDNIFQDNVAFDENMRCDKMQAINMQCDEPNSNNPTAPNKDKNILHGSDMTELRNSSGDIIVGQVYETKEDLKTKLGIDAMKKIFEFKVKRSNKEIFEVGCVDEGCMWKLRASKERKSSYLIGFISVEPRQPKWIHI
ncbi:hypothetical protein L3X38_036028 [Prunus dulcis]|uniref:Transposase MuDR plant domain-containing protein n=1 Tax=Prunus dulcis TaxID=3755 RepID=A0AAD4V2I6_PRUDU|nr:hypothetical protein L3X38_036028 [Prunus dulcis]